jgi:hypothetical protein
MGLELSQLHNLLASRRGNIHVEYLPDHVARHLGAPLGIAYLSSESLKHILKKHPDVTLIDMLCLPLMIRIGTWVEDRPKSACVIFDHPENGRRYKAAIKSAGEGY